MSFTTKIFCTLLLILLFVQCSKYLEQNPDTRVEPKEVDDYQAIIAGAYPGSWHLFTEIMSDNYSYFDYRDFNEPTLVSWLKPMYLWSDNYMLDLPVGPEFAWTNYYHSIYLSNVVLDGIDKAEGEKNLKNSVKGEAYLVRAYCHFMLVNLFAPHYNQQSSPSDLGIPYPLQPEKENKKNYARETVEKVYLLIEEDLVKGLRLLNDKYVKVPKYHFTIASAYAFLSRYYLYKQEWDKCILYSDSALFINSTVRNLIEDNKKFLDQNDFDGFSKDYFSIDKDNLLLINKVLEWNSRSNNGFYANDFMNNFPSYDIRGKLFVFNNNTTPNWHTLKFMSQFKDGQQYSNAPIFSVEELLLNRAEAMAISQPGNLQLALDDLNSILKYRIDGFTGYSVNEFKGQNDPAQLLILETVLEERRFELCYEGHRWFDLKRYQIPITHQTDAGDITLAGDDLRYALQIPEKEVAANELMKPNPR